MKGSYTVRVHNRRVTFTLRLERNITIICGNSATGKTTLVNAIAFYEELGSQSGVTIESSRPCVTLRGKNWQQKLCQISGSFVFLDEGNSFVRSREFAEMIRGSDNYYVIVTRENLFQLPYSVTSVLELRKTSSRFNHTYNRTYPRYDFVEHYDLLKAGLDLYLTEDTNSGSDFFSCVAEWDGIQCISAGGKDSILTLLKENAGQRIMVIADGAAFGATMAAVYAYSQLHPDDILLYLPESFEWLILSSGVFTDQEIGKILKHPEDHIESREFFSWEQFFTNLLEVRTRGTIAQYSKKKLAQYYLEERNINAILKQIQKQPR